LENLDKENGGFTLVELMLVVFIISLLSAMSLVYYGIYRERAQAKDLMTTARGCAADVISECVMNNGSIVGLSTHSFSSCDNRYFENTGDVTIMVSGCCTEFRIEAVGSKLTRYKGECSGDYRDKVECDVVGR